MTIPLPDPLTLRSLAREFQTSDDNVRHEYYEVALLAALMRDSELASSLVFKGGTALRLLYGGERFSVDLDFDADRALDMTKLLGRLKRVARAAGLRVTDEKVKRETVLLGLSYEATRRQLKIEVRPTAKKYLASAAIRNIVNRTYPAPVFVRAYPAETLMAGKVAAILNRASSPPRDLYDLLRFLSMGIAYDRTFLSQFERDTRPSAITRRLLRAVDRYDDRQIRSELVALLPLERREWASTHLKGRVKELLQMSLPVRKVR